MTYRYSLFGFSVETNIRLRTPMATASSIEPDLYFYCEVDVEQRELPESDCIYRSLSVNRFGESIEQLYACDSGWIMRFPRVADFTVKSGSITCLLRDPALEYMVEICLLGHVMSYYLELSGVIALHAGAVGFGGTAVLFTGNRTAGKSTLVSSLVSQGFSLLADDISALSENAGRVTCRRGFPQLKLTPEQARIFVGHADDFPLVHPSFKKLSVPASAVGTFSESPLPVSRLYLLERDTIAPSTRESSIHLEEVPFSEAFIQLIRHTFLTDIIDKTQLRSERFSHLTRIVRAVPIKRLRYPSGYGVLPDVRGIIEADLP